MELKFKLTDTATGANASPSKYVIDPEQEGVLIQVLGGDMLDHDAETSHITARLFTGLTDAAGNEIYDGDVLIYHGEMFVVVYNVKRAQFRAFTNGSGPGDEYDVGVLLINQESKIVGNRWQPEFKGVFENV